MVSGGAWSTEQTLVGWGCDHEKYSYKEILRCGVPEVLWGMSGHKYVCVSRTKQELWNQTVTQNSQHPKELGDAINMASSLSSQWLCGLLGQRSSCYTARLMDPVRLVPGNENKNRFTKVNLRSKSKILFPFHISLWTSLWYSMI